MKRLLAISLLASAAAFAQPNLPITGFALRAMPYAIRSARGVEYGIRVNFHTDDSSVSMFAATVAYFCDGRAEFRTVIATKDQSGYGNVMVPLGAVAGAPVPQIDVVFTGGIEILSTGRQQSVLAPPPAGPES